MRIIPDNDNFCKGIRLSDSFLAGIQEDFQLPKGQNDSLQIVQDDSDVFINTNGLLLDIVWTSSMAIIDAAINSVRIFLCHLPERKLDNTGGVIPDAKLQK